jgi:hypothetical protein
MAQRFRGFRLGKRGGQILRPQREKPARQIVRFAHGADYSGWRRRRQQRLRRIDEADRLNRGIVA